MLNKPTFGSWLIMHDHMLDRTHDLSHDLTWQSLLCPVDSPLAPGCSFPRGTRRCVARGACQNKPSQLSAQGADQPIQKRRFECSKTTHTPFTTKATRPYITMNSFAGSIELTEMEAEHPL